VRFDAEVVAPYSQRMRNSISKRLMGAALAVLALSQFCNWPAAGQTGTPGSPAPPDQAPQLDSSEAEAGKPKIGERIPDSAVERAKLLDNLYAMLATAEDEQTATQTAKAIERLWAVSGSDTVAVLMNRAMKAMHEKKAELALRFLDAIVDQAPDYAEGWSQRAHVLFLENDVQRAVGDLRRALALDPNHFRALGALGHILREVGEKKGALKAYQKLLEVHPFAPGARQALEELEREVGGQGI
jgi:tetratricopeptide (TPR) repeat protein